MDKNILNSKNQKIERQLKTVIEDHLSQNQTHTQF